MTDLCKDLKASDELNPLARGSLRKSRGGGNQHYGGGRGSNSGGAGGSFSRNPGKARGGLGSYGRGRGACFNKKNDRLDKFKN